MNTFEKKHWLVYNPNEPLTAKRFNEFLREFMNPPHYQTCKNCAIYHYVNCRTCFGFGVYEGATLDCPDGVPIAAAEAHDKQFKRAWKACPECHSTPEGIPNS